MACRCGLCGCVLFFFALFFGLFYLYESPHFTQATSLHTRIESSPQIKKGCQRTEQALPVLVVEEPEIKYHNFSDPSQARVHCTEVLYKMTTKRTKPKIFRIGLCDDIQVMVNCALVIGLVHVYTDNETDVHVIVREKDGTPKVGEPDFRIDILVGLGWFMTKAMTHREHLRSEEITEELKTKFATKHILWTKGSKLYNYIGPPSPKLNGSLTPFTVAYSGEAWDNGDCQYSLMFINSLVPKFVQCPTVYWPTAARFMYHREKVKITDLITKPDFDADNVLKYKIFFASFVSKTCWHSHYQSTQVMIRVIIFHLLSEYKQVHALGMCKPRTKDQKVISDTSYIVRGGGPADGPVHLIKNYKFAITAENIAHPGYFTEKLVNGIVAETIPIYWGNPNISSVVNVKRFVLCEAPQSVLDHFESLGKPKGVQDSEDSYSHILKAVEIFRTPFKKCIEEVIALDKNDELYTAKLRQPFLLNNQVEGSVFDGDRAALAVKEVVSYSGIQPYFEKY